MPFNTPETTVSADRVPKTDVETFGGSRRAHGTGLSTTLTRAGPGGDALRTVLDIFAERSVVPAPGQRGQPAAPDDCRAACGRPQEFPGRFWAPCHCPAGTAVGISALACGNAQFSHRSRPWWLPQGRAKEGAACAGRSDQITR